MDIHKPRRCVDEKKKPDKVHFLYWIRWWIPKMNSKLKQAKEDSVCCHWWLLSQSFLNSWTLMIWWMFVRKKSGKSQLSKVRRYKGYSDTHMKGCIIKKKMCFISCIGVWGIQGSIHWFMCSEVTCGTFSGSCPGNQDLLTPCANVDAMWYLEKEEIFDIFISLFLSLIIRILQ